MTDLAKLLNRPRSWVGVMSWKFQGPTACLIGSSSVSLPTPWSLLPRTKAWLILSFGRWTRCASHLMMWLASSRLKILYTWSIHGLAAVASPSLSRGGLYRLKTVTFLRSIHPASTTRRSWISFGMPGHQAICSTGRLRSSHLPAGTVMGLPFLSRLCLPFLLSTGMGAQRLLTLAAVQISQHGMKMYVCDGM